MKFLSSILCILFLLVQCENKKEEKKQISKKEIKTRQFNRNRYIQYDQIKNLSFTELIEKYAVSSTPPKYFPYMQENFILGDYDGAISEFRIELLNFHSEEEIKSKDILIKEVTWEANATENLTIWYERKKRQWLPLHYLIWDKGAEF